MNYEIKFDGYSENNHEYYRNQVKIGRFLRRILEEIAGNEERTDTKQLQVKTIEY